MAKQALKKYEVKEKVLPRAEDLLNSVCGKPSHTHKTLIEPIKPIEDPFDKSFLVKHEADKASQKNSRNLPLARKEMKIQWQKIQVIKMMQESDKSLKKTFKMLRKTPS